MKTQKGSMVIVFLIIALVALVGLFLLLIELSKDKEIDVNSPPNQTVNQVALNSNTKIKEAMNMFSDIVGNRRETGVQGLFCTGGFIGETEPRLKNIANTIVSNRIISKNPVEYAVSQSDAGIVCLGSIEKWVLFAALNQVGDSDTKNYWCIDSSGISGNYGYNSETNQCLNQETL